ncbi:MAG: hypothetical protein H0U50_14465 [Pyrinomonadaceae bacterium]|nr:hypothetical protein [Pyrinomonadaceae bacterium]
MAITNQSKKSRIQLLPQTLPDLPRSESAETVKPEASLISYEAFTVGAEADGNATRLELYLAFLNDGKNQFFNR